MNPLIKQFTPWIAPMVAGLVVFVALMAVPSTYTLFALLGLVGVAGACAFTAVVTYSPGSDLGRRIAMTIVAIAWLVAPWSGVQVAGPLTLPEAILALPAIVAVFPSGRRAKLNKVLNTFPFGAMALIVIGSVLAFIGNQEATSADLLFVTRLAFNSMLCFFIIRRLDPNQRELELLTVVWVAGVLISDLWSLAGGVAAGGRAVGFTGHPNQVAMMSAMVLPLILVLPTRAGIVRSKRALLSPPAILVGAVVLVLAASVGSGARSGLLSVAAVGLLIGYRYIGLISSAVLGVLALTAFLMSGIVEALSQTGTSAFARLTSGGTTTSHSDTQRNRLLNDQWNEIVSGHWFIGRGFNYVGLRPHNIWLEIWGGAGLVGLIGLLLLCIPVFLYAIRRQPDVHPITVAMAIGFIGYLVALTFNNAFELPFMWTFFALWERWRWIPSTPSVQTSPSSGPPGVELPTSQPSLASTRR